MVHFGNEWDTLLGSEMEKPYYQELRQFLTQEYRTATVTRTSTTSSTHSNIPLTAAFVWSFSDRTPTMDPIRLMG